MKSKHDSDIKDFKFQVKDLDKENKRKEKEIHNLSRNIENARSTIKTYKHEKSQLLIGKSKLEAELGKLKKMKTTKIKDLPQSKQNTDDENANHTSSPDVILDQPELLFLPSMIAHWNPHDTKSYQGAGSITSMISHYKDDFEKNGELITRGVFEELIEEFRAQPKADRVKILEEIRKDFCWWKES